MQAVRRGDTGVRPLRKHHAEVDAVRRSRSEMDNGALWCVESDGRAIYKLDPTDGRPVARIQLTKEDPEPHGLEISNGVLWYRDAASSWSCRLT